MAQKLLGLLDAIAVEIDYRRNAQFFVETTGQVVVTKANVICEVLPCDGLRVVFMEIGHRLPHQTLRLTAQLAPAHQRGVQVC